VRACVRERTLARVRVRAPESSRRPAKYQT